MHFEKDLDFYFNQSGPVLGLSSTFSSFLRQVEGASTSHGENNAELNINYKAVRKYNRIHDIFLQFTSNERAILRAYFDQEQLYHITLRALFGDFAGVALFNNELSNLIYVEAYPTGCQVHVHADKKLAKSILAQSKATMKQLQNKYEELLCKQ